MQWNPDALDDDPDVAEIETRRPSKQRPRWLMRLAIALLVIAALVLVVLRLTAPKASATLQQVQFVNKYAVEIDFLATNKTDGELYVLPRLAERAGFAVTGATVRGEFTEGRVSPILLGEGASTVVSLRVAVVDCLLAAKDGSTLPDLAILAGPYSGSRDTVHVMGTLPTWRSLLPPVCDDAADRGVASLAKVAVVNAGNQAAQVGLTIQNTGGRAISMVPRKAQQEIGHVLVRPAENGETLAPGASAVFEVSVTRADCTTSGDGAAVIVLEFDVRKGPRQQLPVELSPSWSNLLGPCAADAGPFGG